MMNETYRARLLRARVIKNSPTKSGLLKIVDLIFTEAAIDPHRVIRQIPLFTALCTFFYPFSLFFALYTHIFMRATKHKAVMNLDVFLTLC